jgi:hypothetical protein
LCVLSKDKKGIVHDSQDEEKSMGEVQSTREYKNIPVVARFPAPVQTGPGAHPASYTMDIM